MGLEGQIVQAVTALLGLVVSYVAAYLARHTKNWLATHEAATRASLANNVVHGLATIAESVVQDLNQRIVSDAKKNGVWTAQLAAQVKADAVRAVLDEGARLAHLGAGVVGDVPELVTSLVERAVLKCGAPR